MLNRRIMLSTVFAFSTTLALAHPGHTLEPEKIAEIGKELLNFRGDMKTAVLARDAALLKAMYAADFTHTHASGQVDGREARILTMIGNQSTIETAQVSDPAVRVYGPDMAIVSGKSTFPDSKTGKDYDVRWMQILSRVSGNLQIVSSQATRLPATS
jgi:Domain of unknown function (DUF4440)